MTSLSASPEIHQSSRGPQQHPDMQEPEGVVFTSRADFTVMGGLLRWAGILALVAIVGAVLLELSLGTWFLIGMMLAVRQSCTTPPGR